MRYSGEAYPPMVLDDNGPDAKQHNQRQVFKFLVEHLDSQEAFTWDNLMAMTTWTATTLETYASKHLAEFLISTEDGRLRVAEVFRRFASWEKFRQHVTQKRSVIAKYNRRTANYVRIYEFFMPLTNEEPLRSALDSLFYRNQVLNRLRVIGSTKLHTVLQRGMLESEEEYESRLCDWISARFVGYSVYHVSGRFRALPLMSRAEAAKSLERYLVDETTAVTRFIFPCHSKEEAAQVDFFFRELFVHAVLQIVPGEDEIWMVETGMENRLHIWSSSDQQ